jgi:hypothetical protein
MKYDVMAFATVFWFVLGESLMAQTPQMKTVEPESGKIGAVLQVHGLALSKANVGEVFLTDHTLDMKVKILDQKDDLIEFRIPPSVGAGRLQLVVKTTGKHPLLLEQPAYVTVEEPTEQSEILESREPDNRVKQASVLIQSLADTSLIEGHLATKKDELVTQNRSVRPPQLSSGRLIWTGALQKNTLLTFSAAGASSGVLNGRLPGAPVSISVRPAELVDGGIAVYSKNRERGRTSESTGAWNGWNVVVRDWSPKHATRVNVIEVPGPTNEWKRLVLRNGNHHVSVVVIEWQRTPLQ